MADSPQFKVGISILETPTISILETIGYTLSNKGTPSCLLTHLSFSPSAASITSPISIEALSSSCVISTFSIFINFGFLIIATKQFKFSLPSPYKAFQSLSLTLNPHHPSSAVFLHISSICVNYSPNGRIVKISRTYIIDQ